MCESGFLEQKYVFIAVKCTIYYYMYILLAHPLCDIFLVSIHASVAFPNLPFCFNLFASDTTLCLLAFLL